MRRLYTLLGYAVLPFLPLRLWWRGRREPGYRSHVGERFGRFAPAPRGPLLWVHAVSLGETRAALPLIETILAAHSDWTVLLTHMTATGREAGRAALGPRVVQAWLPYDVPVLMRAFVRHYRPLAAVLLETEVWPNLVAACARHAVPVFLVNARLSERSARGYARLGALARTTFATLAGVAAQTADDAQRLQALGAPPPAVTGNLKFDVDIPAAAQGLARELRALFGSGRRVLLAASTRDGEERLLLDAFASAALTGDLLLVLVPRHPQRFDAVADMLAARAVPFVRRSANAPVPPDIRVVVGDSMGEMAAYCAAADVVFVGGSLLPFGGQNLIEPIAASKPTLIGPHTFNFADITANAVAAGAARRVQTAAELMQAVAALLDDPIARERMTEATQAFHRAHRGAGARLWQWLAPRLPPPQARR